MVYLFKKSKNHNLNKYVLLKEKKGVSMFGESPCIVIIRPPICYSLISKNIVFLIIINEPHKLNVQSSLIRRNDYNKCCGT